MKNSKFLIRCLILSLCLVWILSFYFFIPNGIKELDKPCVILFETSTDCPDDVISTLPDSKIYSSDPGVNYVFIPDGGIDNLPLITGRLGFAFNTSLFQEYTSDYSKFSDSIYWKKFEKNISDQIASSCKYEIRKIIWLNNFEFSRLDSDGERYISSLEEAALAEASGWFPPPPKDHIYETQKRAFLTTVLDYYGESEISEIIKGNCACPVSLPDATESGKETENEK